MADRKRKARQDVLAAIEKGEVIVVDTNIIVTAAQDRDMVFLQKLMSYDKYVPTNLNMQEFYGMVAYADLDQATKKIIEGFREAIKPRVKAIPQKYLEIEGELLQIAPYVPRSIAYEVVVPYLDVLWDLFTELLPRAKSLLTQDYQRIAELLDEKKELYPCAVNLYNRYKKADKIPAGYDEKAYLVDIQRHINGAMKQIERAVTKGISVVVSVIDQLRKKEHSGDVKLVAEALVHGATTYTEDPDVEWLITLHYLGYRRVA